MTASITTNSFAHSKPAENSPHPWIINPLIDTLFGFGGIVWIFYLFHAFVLNGQTAGLLPETLLAISATGAIIFAETHTVTTIFTVYKDRETIDKFSFYTNWLACGLLALVVAGTIFGGTAPVFVKVYLLFVPHHFMAQSYGIALMYCMKRGYRPTEWDRSCLMIFTQATAWYAVVKQLTYKTWSGDSFLLTPIPFWGPLPPVFDTISEITLYVAALMLVSTIAYKSFTSRETFPIPAQLTLLTGATAFTLGPVLTGIFWLYVSAFFHGTQYLMIVLSKHIKESNPEENISGSQISRHLFKGPALKFLALSLILSYAIYHLLPTLPDYLPFRTLGFDHLGFAAIIFSAMNLFHIITDSAIWKLKDKRTRNLLIN